MSWFSGILLGSLGAVLTTVSASLGTWKLFFLDSFIDSDFELIRIIKRLPDDGNIQKENGKNSKITFTNPKEEQIKKLEISVSKNHDQTFSFKFQNESGEEKEIAGGVKCWECVLNGNDLDEKVTKIKNSIGFKTSDSKITPELKSHLIKFVKFCVLKGNPWRPQKTEKDNKLTRTVEVEKTKIPEYLYISS